MNKKLLVDELFSIVLFLLPVLFTGSITEWPDYWELPLLVACYCSRIICTVLSVLILYHGIKNYLKKE